MSILTATSDDFGGGRPLPNGTYRVTILDAKLERMPDTQDHSITNERLMGMVGNITTPTGETEIPGDNGSPPFRIGARKLFFREWLHFPRSAEAERIGHANIKRQAVAVGLLRRPKKGESIPLNIDDAYASSLLGRTGLVRTQIRTTYKNQAGVIQRTRGLSQAEIDAKVAAGDWVKAEPQAEIVAWVEQP